MTVVFFFNIATSHGRSFIELGSNMLYVIWCNEFVADYNLFSPHSSLLLMALTFYRTLTFRTIFLLLFVCFEPSTDIYIYIQPRALTVVPESIIFRLVECRCLWFLRSRVLILCFSPFPPSPLIYGRWLPSFRSEFIQTFQKITCSRLFH